MEKPTVGPNGEPRWQPNGARQRYAARLVEEVDSPRLIAAAGQVLFHRKLRLGEIGPDDCISPSVEELLSMMRWSDLRQLRLLRKLAESMTMERERLQ